MNKELLAKVPKKFKIIPHEVALRWVNNREKFDTLGIDYKRVVLRSLCFWDIGYFARRVTRRWTTGKKSGIRYPIPDFHKELWDLGTRDEDLLVICHRGSAKTTAMSKILALWFLLFEIEPSIIIVASSGLGEIIIGDIRLELETNELIVFLFGNVVPTKKKTDNGEKWRQTELQLVTGVEVKTVTKGQAVRGQRPTLILIDDPEENKDVKNPIMVQEFFDWVFSTLYGALDDGGRMIVLGTVISSNCFVQRLKSEHKERGFNVFEFPAIIGFDWDTYHKTGDFMASVKNARPLWKDRWSLEKLFERYNKLKPKPFFQEYMNIPYVKNGSPVFTHTTLKKVEALETVGEWKIFVPREELKIGYIGVDVANGSLAGDYSVISVRDKDYRLLALYRAKIPQDVLAKETDFIVSLFEDVFIVPENNIALAYIQKCLTYVWGQKIYKQRTMDKITQKENDVLGWNTNTKTKPLLINQYEVLLREGLEVNDVMQEEIEHYYYDERGGMNAISPYHDDTIIADALAVQAVKQGLPSPQLLFI